MSGVRTLVFLRGLDEGREAYCKRVYQELALSYQVDPWYGIVKGYYPAYFTASGGLISTAADLAKFDIAIDENFLVSEKTKIEMFTRTLSNAGTELPYGLGWPLTYVSVTSEDEKLYVELPGEAVFVLYPESETNFFHTSFDETDDFEVTLIKDETGEVTHSILEVQGQKFSFKRVSS